MSEASAHSVSVGGSVWCQQFVGRDQINYHGFSAADVEQIIAGVVRLLQGGAQFAPCGEGGDAFTLALDGERLVFAAGAARRLSACRSERTHLLALALRQDYRIWATHFIPLSGRMDVRREIAGLEIPVSFSEFRVPPAGAGPEAQVTLEPLPDILTALGRHAAFILLGEPGGGKTTTLQKIAFEAARRLLAGGEERIPLFVRLSQQAGRSPFAFLGEEWTAAVGGNFADAWAAGRVLALVDGVNEIARQERDARLKDWGVLLCDRLGGNQVVFSGRERDYENQLDIPRVLINPLADEQIGAYLRCNAAEGLQALLDEPGSRLGELARNPFNLCLLTAAYKSNQGGMSNRGALLRWFAGELLRREEKLAHRDWLPAAAQAEALARLAFAMQEQGEGTTFAVATAQAALPRRGQNAEGETLEILPAVVLRLGRCATLLDPALTGEVRFYHHLLQEYFAAQELLRRFAGGEDLSRLWRARRLQAEMPAAQVGEWDALPEPPGTGWEVTTLLACGLAADPAALVTAVAAHNPALAGRCLDEAGRAEIETVLRGGLAVGKRSAHPGLAQALEATRRRLAAEVYDPAVHLRARLLAGFTLGRIGDPRLQAEEVDGVAVVWPDLIPVAAGRYRAGSAADDDQAFDDERPAFWSELPEFCIGRRPVTNAEFACFVAAGGYERPAYWAGETARRWLAGEEVAGGQMKTVLDFWQTLKDTPGWKAQVAGRWSPQQIETWEYLAALSREEVIAQFSKDLTQKSRRRPHYWEDRLYNNPAQPVVGVTWFEAQAYGAWLTAFGRRVYRLPHEVEWEAAGRGRQGRRYPWGDEWADGRANTLEGRVLRPSPVGVYAAGRRGEEAEDLAGNVWEWCQNPYRPYPLRLDDGAAGEEYVLRGGSWDGDDRLARCAYRDWDVPGDFNILAGFRVLSPGSPSAC